MTNLTTGMLCILYIIVVIIMGLFYKVWSSFDKYFEKKAENYATKQDVAEITTETKKVESEFYKILGKFDADLKFKYKFYEDQYKELYSELYREICKSETLRYILCDLADEKLNFADIPIIEYTSEYNMTCSQNGDDSVNKRIVSLISTKHIYASPKLIKLTCMLENIEKYENTSDTNERGVQMERVIKVNIIKTILRDYYWLRQQLHLQKNDDETDRVETEQFISILFNES